MDLLHALGEFEPPDLVPACEDVDCYYELIIDFRVL